jgi:hypothetical protein
MNGAGGWTAEAVLARVRQFVLALLVLGLAGTATELLALAHYEDSWQLVPFVLIALALIVVAWHLYDRSAASVRMLRLVMGCFIVAGIAGIILHYRGNLEFQLEIDPSQDHWTLFKKIIRAKAPPALAPGVMAQLGLLGLTYAFRHPALSRTDAGER